MTCFTKQHVLFAAALTTLTATTIAAPLLQVEAQNKPKEVNVYSGRHYNTDKALYAEFTRRTGIKVNLLEGKDDELIQRLKSEGRNSKADLLVLVDAARLYRAQQDNLFRPIRSTELNKDVPAKLRDPGGRWYALTRRARPVMINTAVVNPRLVRTYADLARPELKGKLCMRNRASVYSQSLVADELVRRGAPATRTWLKGVVANLQQPVFSSDTTMVRAVGQGQCGAAIANQYYLARLLRGDNAADRAIAQKVRVVWPDPTHVNVTAGGVTRSSRNPDGARRLLEFLASPTSGEGYAEANNEYPVRGWGNNPTLRAFGSFKPSPVSMEQLGRRNREAVQLMTQAGWN
ncbi:MAG: extracellular solute-binding protein [Cyanobacteriota bacterium]|nr:extracellular solute-binding protein [Cyanobacteriota bacterium]